MMRTLLGHRTHIRRRLICPIGEQIISCNYSRKLIDSDDDIQANSDKKKLTDRSACLLRILGSGAEGAAKSVLFSTRKNSYLFNAGSGIQRICHEYNVPLQTMKHIFCTYSNWENIGGLIGLLISKRMSHSNDITVHAPIDLKSFCDMSKLFANFHGLNLQTEECTKIKYFADESLSIEYVTLKSNKSLRSVIDEPKSHNKDNKDDDPKLFIENLSSKTETVQTAVAFICRIASIPPRLDLEKCVNKGVPPGYLGKLQNGVEVTLPNGTVVSIKDLIRPKVPEAVFIMVECPTSDFLDSLINEKSFETYQENGISDEKNIPRYVIHFTPSDVIADQRYQNWMKKFSISTQHVNVNDCNKCTGCVGSHELQHILHLVDPEVHPMLRDDSIPTVNYDLADVVCSTTDQTSTSGLRRHDVFIPRKKFNLPDNVGNTLRTLRLRQLTKEDKVKDCLHINPDHFIEKLLQDQTLRDQFDSMKKQIARKFTQNEIVNSTNQFPIVTFLGTGSAYATKYRSVSSILVSVDYDNHFILDCGEGTYAQLIRHFGVERTTEIVSNTKLIFISHIHTDHQLGLITLLKKRRKAMQKLGKQFEKVFSLVPTTMIRWLQHYHQYFEDISDDSEFVQAYDLDHRNLRGHHWQKKIRQVTGLADIRTAFAVHCPQSFGISFTTKSGFKITYSGDTMPSKELISIGENSTLLIHEATYQDEYLSEAKQRLHSTCSEAIDVGKLMRAKYTILTHFSQRYPLVPVLEQGCPENVGVAFDNMRVTMNNLPKLGSLFPLYQFLFEIYTKRNKVTYLNEGLNQE